MPSEASEASQPAALAAAGGHSGGAPTPAVEEGRQDHDAPGEVARQSPATPAEKQPPLMDAREAEDRIGAEVLERLRSCFNGRIGRVRHLDSQDLLF